MGRVLVTNLGKCCKSKLDLSAGGGTRAVKITEENVVPSALGPGEVCFCGVDYCEELHSKSLPCSIS